MRKYVSDKADSAICLKRSSSKIAELCEFEFEEKLWDVDFVWKNIVIHIVIIFIYIHTRKNHYSSSIICNPAFS